MSDANYWKDPANKNAYGEKDWRDADAKVELVKSIIKEATGKNCCKVGFGAATTEFIDGSAASHGHQKGDADLQVEGTDIYIEVTGPNVDYVGADKPLWVRPDKFDAACKEGGKKTVIVHVLPTKTDPVIRAIVCDQELCARIKNNQFKIDEPRIKGRTERFVSIPATDKCVLPFGAVLEILKSI